MKKIFFFLAASTLLSVAVMLNVESVIDLIQGEPGFFAYEFTDRGADFVKHLVGMICVLIVGFFYIGSIFYDEETDDVEDDVLDAFAPSKKTCICVHGLTFFQLGKEYEYLERFDEDFNAPTNEDKCVIDIDGDKWYYTNAEFIERFAIKQQ